MKGKVVQEASTAERGAHVKNPAATFLLAGSEPGSRGSISESISIISARNDDA